MHQGLCKISKLSSGMRASKIASSGILKEITIDPYAFLLAIL
jgi:hypothetical protein